jgi:hypothetical protein
MVNIMDSSECEKYIVPSTNNEKLHVDLTSSSTDEATEAERCEPALVTQGWCFTLRIWSHTGPFTPKLAAEFGVVICIFRKTATKWILFHGYCIWARYRKSTTWASVFIWRGDSGGIPVPSRFLDWYWHAASIWINLNKGKTTSVRA